MKKLALDLFVILFFFKTGVVLAQQPIFLTNPSFEDRPQYAKVPGGWRNCAFNGETPPDVHPLNGGPFQVNQKPQHGETYLGLVVRENQTVESIGQELAAPLAEGSCYALSLTLCKSAQLFSRNRSGGGNVNYDRPAVLRIWGGISPCGQKSLLAESPLVENLSWKEFNFRFRAPGSLTWISFEAYFDPEATAPYNGNLLLDHISPIVPIDCGTLEPLVDLTKTKAPEQSFQKIKVRGYSRHFVPIENGYSTPVMFNRVETVPDLKNLLELNCPRIGFVSGTFEFVDGPFSALKEVAYNVRQFPDRQLVVGLPETDEKLTRERTKALKRLFREVNLKRGQYRIVSKNSEGQDWYCGNREIWLKLE